MNLMSRTTAVVVTPIVLLIAAMTAVSAQPTDPAGPAAAAGLEQREGDSVVDYAPAADPAAPDVVSAVAAMEVAAAEAATDASADAEPIAESAVSVVFDPANPSPANVQNVVRAAIGDWTAKLDTSGGPIEIQVLWFPFGNQQVLGSAGFLRAFRGDGTTLPADSFTPGPLANVLIGSDLTPGEPEIQVVLNKDFGSRWFIGTSGVPSGNQVDLYSVVLHELGHGFGFVGSATSTNGAPPQLNDPPFGFDTNVWSQGRPLLDAANPNALLTSGLLYFDLPDGRRHKLYAPSTWAQGSSYSHFDEATFRGSDPGALMTPQLGNAEVQRRLDGAVLGAMEHIGWSLRGSTPPPPPPPPGGGTIGGVVTSTGGSPVGNLKLNLFEAVNTSQRGEFLGPVRTDASGRYAFGGLDAGCYIVVFIAPAGGQFPASGGPYLQKHVCISAGQSKTDVNAVVSVGTTATQITGVVTNQGGQAVQGLKVDRFEAAGDGTRATFLGFQRTGSDGRFTFSGAEPGCYVLVFIAPDGFQMVGGNRYLERRVCVEAGQTGTVNAQVRAG